MIKDILIDNIYEILIITIEILNFFKKNNDCFFVCIVEK